MDLYNKYYEEDPQRRVPPLPTVIIPALPAGDALVYYLYMRAGGDSPLRPSKQLVDSIMVDLWRKMRELHSTIAKHPQRNMILQGMCKLDT